MQDDTNTDSQPGSSEGGSPREYGQRRRGGRSRPAAPSFEPQSAPRRPRPPSAPEPEAVKPMKELLVELLVRMGVPDTEIVYIPRSEGEYLEVRGPDLGNLIGRHGHTLEALNLIFNNIVNAGVRKERRYYTIDAEGYRARRADQLKSLALQTLERVMREKRSIALEPMLPSERKVVHLALADSPFVSTQSEGVEPERRLIVSPK